MVVRGLGDKGGDLQGLPHWVVVRGLGDKGGRPVGITSLGGGKGVRGQGGGDLQGLPHWVVVRGLGDKGGGATYRDYLIGWW